MGFWDDFAHGFNSGIDPVKKVTKNIPVVGDVYGAIPRLHKGGKVPKTGNYRLRSGEVVLNRTQQAQIRKAKTPATIKRVVRKVAKQRPKPAKGRRRVAVKRRRR